MEVIYIKEKSVKKRKPVNYAEEKSFFYMPYNTFIASNGDIYTLKKGIQYKIFKNGKVVYKSSILAWFLDFPFPYLIYLFILFILNGLKIFQAMEKRKN